MKLSKKKKFLIAAAAVIIIEIVVSTIQRLKNLNVKNLLETVLLIVTVMGIFDKSEEKETVVPAASPINLTSQKQKTYYLSVSFESGIYGGAIAGILSGTLIMFIVLTMPNHPDLIECLKIIPYCGMTGVLFGGLIHVGRKSLLESEWFPKPVSNLLGCLVASIIAGGLPGMLGMWLFGENPFQFIGYDEY